MNRDRFATDGAAARADAAPGARRCAAWIASLTLAAFAAAGAAMPWVQISARDPRYLELDDGRPFVPIGLNMAHPVGPAGRERETMERWVSALSSNGGNLIRIWLSHPWWNPEREPGRFDEEAARRLNDLLDFCGRRGVRVKITLDHIREIDPAIARQRWALRSSYHVSQGGPLRSMDELWTSAAGRELFVRRLDWLATRFADRPEIFGWELWNEINAARGDPTHQLQWTVDMLAELRRRFPRHLAMQSLGSFDRDAMRPLYRRYALLPDNMLAQVHRYLDLGAALPVCHGPMDVLAADAVRELSELEARKPVLLAEGGR